VSARTVAPPTQVLCEPIVQSIRGPGGRRLAAGGQQQRQQVQRQRGLWGLGPAVVPGGLLNVTLVYPSATSAEVVLAVLLTVRAERGWGLREAPGRAEAGQGSRGAEGVASRQSIVSEEG
jgi:hypothetical protein